MKSIATIIVAVGLLLSCSNGSVNNNDDKKQQTQQLTIVGRWSLVHASGGIGGWQYDYDRGSRIVEFTVDGSYRTYSHDTLNSTENYWIVRDESVLTKDTMNLINYSGGNFAITTAVRELTVDSLVLSDECWDCFTRTYVRIR